MRTSFLNSKPMVYNDGCAQTSRFSGFVRRFGFGARLGGILLAGIAAGYLLLMLVYAIPAGAFLGNLKESITVFDPDEGAHEEAEETLVKGYSSTWLDNATDVRFLFHAAYASPDEPLYQQALQIQWHASGTLIDSLIDYVKNGAEGMETLSYARYWHGYLILLKPLLLLCSYQDIRMLNMVVQAALCLLLFSLMRKRSLGRYSPALCCALMCLTPIVLPLCMQYAVVYTITLIAMCVILLRADRFAQKRNAAVFFMVTGMATCYFDLLTYPLLSLGLPLTLYLLMEDERREKGFLCTALNMSACWLLGYAGMWAGKWTLLGLSGDAKGLHLVGDTVALRMSDAETGRLSAIERNVAVLWRKPFKLLATAAVVAAVVQWARVRGRRASTPPAFAWALLTLIALPFVWFFVLSNHSHIHYYFTYRILAVSVFALLCLVTRMLKPQAAPTL